MLISYKFSKLCFLLYKENKLNNIQMKINLQICMKFSHEEHFGLYTSMSDELFPTCLRTLVSIIEIVRYY